MRSANRERPPAMSIALRRPCRGTDVTMRDIRHHDPCNVNATKSDGMPGMSDTPGARLKAARKEKGFTQAQLAELCGFEGPSRIGNYEADAREPSREDWITIGQVLG